jgi:hypothetical protein
VLRGDLDLDLDLDLDPDLDPDLDLGPSDLFRSSRAGCAVTRAAGVVPHP